MEEKKVYVVRFGEYSDQGIAGVFSTKEKAEFYCKVQNEIDSWYDDSYWVDEYVLDKGEIPEDAKVETYYIVCISKVTDDFEKAGTIYLRDEIKQIFTVPTIVTDEGDYISVSSTESMEHAEKVAIDRYYKWKAEQEGLV